MAIDRGEHPFDEYDFEEYDFEDDDPLDERSVEPIRRSRAVRWTAILIVASFALAGLSSLSNWW